MTAISPTPSNWPVRHVIFVPSGDQSGSKSYALLCVSWISPDPSAFITRISQFPPR